MPRKKQATSTPTLIEVPNLEPRVSEVGATIYGPAPDTPECTTSQNPLSDYVHANPWRHPTNDYDVIPERVAIVALGTSRTDYDQLRLGNGDPGVEFDEVWTCNRGGRLWQHDLCFIMDDLKREAALDPAYGDWIEAYPGPVITSCASPDYTARFGDNVHALPLGRIMLWMRQHRLRAYLHNSIPIMVAYAAWIGVKEIYIHGADYTRPDGQIVEWGRANLEYLIGALEVMGCTIGLSAGLRLCGHNEHPPGWVYGYDRLWQSRGVIKEAETILQRTREDMGIARTDEPSGSL